MLCFLVFVSYYATYTFLTHAEPSGPIGCERIGTLKIKCCQEHIINRSPSNPAGPLVNYCTDCDIGPGGEPNYQNCSERYIQMFEQDPNPQPPTKPPFSERIPPGVIGETQPLTEQDQNGINQNVPYQQDFAGQLHSSETLGGDNVADDEQNKDFSALSDENNRDVSTIDKENDTNS